MHFQSFRLNYRSTTSDGRHLTFVFITKNFRSFSTDEVHDLFSDVHTLLHSNRSKSREGAAVLQVKRTHISNNEYIRIRRNTQIAIDDNPSNSIKWYTQLL